MRSCLVTGGAGFIGSHLAEYLLKKGERVHVIDDLSTGSISNIAHLKADKNFSYSIDTIMNRSLMAELVDVADAVFHMAASVGVKYVIQNPRSTIEANVEGTKVVLDVASKKGKKVIIASSSEVYGKNILMPFDESGDLVLGDTSNGRWCYACSKAIDEFMALAYHKESRIPVVIVRLFNVIGTRQTGRYGMVAPTFISQALAGEPVTVYGDGEQTRCFAWVGDIVDTLWALSNEPRAEGQIYNVGSNIEISINELAKLVVEVTKSKSPIVHIPYTDAYGDGFEDMARRQPSLTKLKALVGYEQSKSLREVLEIICREMSY